MKKLNQERKKSNADIIYNLYSVFPPVDGL